MNGDWTVQIEDGTHTIHADITSDLLGDRLKVAWDGEVLESSRLGLLLGDLRSFQRNGHSFLLNVHGFGLLGHLVLSMDGVEVPRGGVATPMKQPPQAAAIQFIKELSVQESEEVVGTEEYPLDNRFGDQSLTTVHQVSRESTNELSIDTSTQVGGNVGLTVLSAIKAEIEAQVSQQTGQKIGEKVTESQTLTFSVGPKSSVVYEVVWKRKVRSGERLYLSGGQQMTVPYRINYGLTFEVRTQA
ncbi:MAG TPA: hypothetical protein VN776_13940 [Terracidiphilus sp.]|nr:hypothetical protein [Terracidiphilus sp.]